jgi:hypothetical protein
MTLAAGQCGGKVCGGGFSFQDHSAAGTIDATLHPQSEHTARANAAAKSRLVNACIQGSEPKDVSQQAK